METQRLRSVFDQATAPMALLFGPELRFSLLNTPALNFIDRTRVEVEGRPLLEVMEILGGAAGPRFRSLVKPMIDQLRRTFETGEPLVTKDIREFSRNENGLKNERYYDLSSYPYFENDKIAGVIAIHRDSTERVISLRCLAETQRQLSLAKAAAEAALQTKSAFLANVSHEIRTPLASIMGFSRLLKERNLEPKERDQFADTILRSGIALTSIIDDILDLAEVEAGHLEIDFIDFSVCDLTSGTIELFREKARQKGIEVLLFINDDVPKRILSDPARLRQILVNLIGNAVKFTHSGSVRVSVTSVELDKENVGIEILVKDTGVGLTTQEKQRLFQPFVQADNSMSRKFGGTGLGLVLSQRLSQALGGWISIEDDTSEHGCTFKLQFPAKVFTESRATDVKAHIFVQPNSQPLRGLRVLVVDDSKDNQFLVKRLLVKNGAKVETANDGREGLRKAISGRHDIVLMDIQMPEMDGYQAKQALDRHGYQAPVVALTAHAMTEERVRTLDAGFLAHLTKPLMPDDLVGTVLRLTRHMH